MGLFVLRRYHWYTVVMRNIRKNVLLIVSGLLVGIFIGLGIASRITEKLDSASLERVFNAR